MKSLWSQERLFYNLNFVFIVKDSPHSPPHYSLPNDNLHYMQSEKSPYLWLHRILIVTARKRLKSLPLVNYQ